VAELGLFLVLRYHGNYRTAFPDSSGYLAAPWPRCPSLSVTASLANGRLACRSSLPQGPKAPSNTPPAPNMLRSIVGFGATMELSLHEPRKVPLDLLEFDRENPRFAPTHDMDKSSDVEVILALVRVADLGELLQSIATSGYVDIEPLIVQQEAQEDEKLIVLEGNRRLAALRLLTDSELAREVGVELPAISPGVQDSFRQVTAYRVGDREEARDFIGFKHINGPHRWDSLAKARFAARWYEHERSQGITLRDIARRMGDRHDTIQRMVAGLYVLQQAERTRLFHFDDVYPGRSFAFSHLYTALTRPGYREFLGLPDDWRRIDPEPDPVSEPFLPHLRQVLLWLYGSKQDSIRPVVVSQNPNVRELGEVLANPKARAIMAAQQDLRAAYAEVDTPGLQFERSLVEAHRHLEKALSKVDAFASGDETLIQLAREVSSKALILLTVMQSKTKEGFSPAT